MIRRDRQWAAVWLGAEILAWVGALVCLAIWAFGTASTEAARREGIREFRAATSLPAAEKPLPALGAPDRTLWSRERVRAWTVAQADTSPGPLGIFRLRQVGIEAPILEGTDDRALDRGIGHIADTPALGHPGNSGLAAHRDGFFRPLKDVRVGDLIEIETTSGLMRYRIDRTWITVPDDVSVLDPTPVESVTLVTCYPFYFVGSAPQRFIVRALRVT
jgi:sortase A